MTQPRRTIEEACSGPLALDEAAALLRVSPSALDRAIRTGQLPGLRGPGQAHVDGPQLMRLLRQPAVINTEAGRRHRHAITSSSSEIRED